MVAYAATQHVRVAVIEQLEVEGVAKQPSLSNHPVKVAEGGR